MTDVRANDLTQIATHIRLAREAMLFHRTATRAPLVVRGKDRLTWLHGLVTCDVTTLVPGQGAYGLLLEKKGKIVCDLHLVPTADALFILVPREVRSEVLAELDHHLIMEDAEITETEDAVAFAHGPRAKVALIAAEGTGVAAAALDVTGLGGVVLVGEGAELNSVIQRSLHDSGGNEGDDATWNVLRHLAGVPEFGVDFDKNFYPQEASIEGVAVSFSKGCYLGQEVVYMLENRGHVKKKLVPLRISAGETRDTPARNAEVHADDGTVIGNVTSAAIDPANGDGLAIANVKRAHATPETKLRVGNRDATVFPARSI